MSDSPTFDQEVQNAERRLALLQLEEWLAGPMVVLSLVWLVFLVAELVWDLPLALEAFIYIIWAIFVLDFVVRFALAPRKVAYLKSNWLMILSLVAPALRVFSIVPYTAHLLVLARATQELQLVQIVASLNLGMRTLQVHLRRRGFGYVVVLTVAVTLAGAAGMHAFEGTVSHDQGFRDYGDALWWTAMTITTLGTGDWPQTVEGRVLGFLLALYAFGVFGYVTAILASFFVGHDERREEKAQGDLMESIEALHAEVESLREEVRAAAGKGPEPGA